MVTQAAKRMQKTIEEAYLDLLEKESFRAVTVTQIAQAALINRQTFYHHYQDKYDLTDRMTAAVFIRVRELIDVRLAQLKRGESVDDFFSFLNLSATQRFLTPALRRRVTALYTIQYDQLSLSQRIHDYVAANLQDLLAPGAPELVSDLLATLLTQVLRTVFERGEFPTPAEIRALKAAFARLLN